MLLLKGGRILDPASGRDEKLDLLVADGKVAKLGKKIEASGAEVVDVKGLVLCPGFIDLHVHLREPGREDSETIRSGTLAAAAGGFTGVACMPNTNPVNDHPAVTESILSEARRSGVVAVYPIAAITKGSEGKELAEFGLLKDAGAVGLSDDGRPVASADVMRRALEYARQYDLPIIDHCEDKALSGGGVMNEGVVATRLGLRGYPGEAEEVMVARDIILARLTRGRIHIAHLSTAGSVRHVRQGKADGIAVTCEVTPHHFALTDEAVGDYDTDAKMNPPLRSRADVDEVLRGLQDGTVDCIATDHAPHNPDDKAVEFDAAPFGVVGLETAVAVALDKLVRARVVSLRRLVELLSVNPARILRLKKGRLAEGDDADLTLLDLDRAVEVHAESFQSLSRNTPFKGRKFRGGPAMTIVAGKIVWRA